MEFSKRKKIRLEDYNYSSAGAYFVTICIADRNVSLWIDTGANAVRANITRANTVRPYNDGETVVLSDVGKIVDAEIQKMDSVYEHIAIDKYCIMPDHIHMIIFILPNENVGGGELCSPAIPTLSRMIKQFKGSITKQIGLSIWQKSFYDRVIRDRQEYLKIWQYIDENLLKWEGMGEHDAGEHSAGEHDREINEVKKWQV